MTTEQVAQRLYTLCKEGKMAEAQSELYAQSATSTEKNFQGEVETVEGLQAIVKKGEQFRSMIQEHHGGWIKEPTFYGDHIFMEMNMDATLTGIGRMNMTEMCHYQVEDGKIKSESFFY